MSQLSTSAAYVRKTAFVDQAALRAAGIRGSVVDEQVWELLATPQTIVSLQRAAGQSEAHRDSQADRDRFEDILERLLDADLIELSPDS